MKKRLSWVLYERWLLLLASQLNKKKQQQHQRYTGDRVTA